LQQDDHNAHLNLVGAEGELLQIDVEEVCWGPLATSRVSPWELGNFILRCLVPTTTRGVKRKWLSDLLIFGCMLTVIVAALIALTNRDVLASPGMNLFALVLLVAVYRCAANYLGDAVRYTACPYYSKHGRVQRRVRRLARSALRAKAHIYDSVVVVGHSLGSIIAADALESMLVTSPGNSRLPNMHFVTMGSPLEKFASFRMDPWNGASRIRFLRRAVQGGAIRWTNFLYRLDPVADHISGAHNRVPGAGWPMVSHVSYWKDLAVGEAILEIATHAWIYEATCRNGTTDSWTKAGSRTVKALPLPSSLSTSMLPPIISAKRRQIASPNPVPP